MTDAHHHHHDDEGPQPIGKGRTATLWGILGALFVVGIGLTVLGGRTQPSTAPAPATITPAPSSPSPSPRAAVTPQPATSSSPSVAATPAPQPPPPRFQADLRRLVPRTVGAFVVASRRPSGRLRGDNAQDVVYRRKDGARFTHTVAVFVSERAAKQALRQRVQILRAQRGHTVVANRVLADDQDAGQGRYVAVRTPARRFIVQWTNRNLLAVIEADGPKQALARYQAFPY